MDEYTTRNLSLAAYLYLHETLLISTIDGRGFDCYTFADKDGSAGRLAEEFLADATAPARTYSVALHQLRRESSDARKAR